MRHTKVLQIKGPANVQIMNMLPVYPIGNYRAFCLVSPSGN